MTRRPRPGRTRRAGDRGAAAVLVLVCAGVLSLAGATTSAVAAVAVARQRAAAVADLAALAAADAALQGAGPACRSARAVAAANGGWLADCRLLGDVARVTGQVRPPGPLGRLGVATATAAAGPEAAERLLEPPAG